MLAFVTRLILILVALSAIRSAIQFAQRILGISGTRAMAPRATASPRAKGATVLQQDPVCGTYVAGDLSLKRIVRGKVIHFCSPECRDRYQAGQGTRTVA
jgi:YHS domain-containing protein